MYIDLFANENDSIKDVSFYCIYFNISDTDYSIITYKSLYISSTFKKKKV